MAVQSAGPEIRFLDTLARQPICGFSPRQSPHSEPTALAAMALCARHRPEAAAKALDWLGEQLAPDGSLGIGPAMPQPHWPTAQAAAAWSLGRRLLDESRWNEFRDRACQFLCRVYGTPLPQTETFGHDTKLIGWPWVAGTHSWLEPTAWAVVALKLAGLDGHARTREAVTLLFDRQLPTGGMNYGNTVVLGNVLRAHPQPSGLALLALAGEPEAPHRAAATIQWLRHTLPSCSAGASLGYGLLGLAAHDAWPDDAPSLLARCWSADECGAVVPRLVLLLAAQGPQSPLIWRGGPQP